MIRRAKAAGAVLAALAVGVSVALSTTTAAADSHNQIRHVLLISVDGMHQSDLDWYVAQHPDSGAFAEAFATGGAVYSNSQTSDPSDSDPGGTALMTGGDPRATGVYYDVEYNHSTYEAGTTSCTGPTGGDVIFDSPDDLDITRLDAGQGDHRAGEQTQFDHADDRQPTNVAEPGDVPGRPEVLPADLAPLIPEGQHDVRGREGRRASDRVV